MGAFLIWKKDSPTGGGAIRMTEGGFYCWEATGWLRLGDFAVEGDFLKRKQKTSGYILSIEHETCDLT